MKFNEHYNLAGSHAFLGASNPAWTNYDEDKLVERYMSSQAAVRGTRLHALACELITMDVKLPRNNQTLSAYVNDAIGYKMQPEQILFYSQNCYGTVDAISFRGNKLRIHDLKTGVVPGKMRQLEVYAALFCLEYKFKPHALDIELRIYQTDEIFVHVPDADDIIQIMEQIKRCDKIIESMKEADS